MGDRLLLFEARMESVKASFGKLIKTLNNEAKNVKVLILISNKLKIQPGELVLIFLSVIITLIILNSLSHALVTLLGMVYPLYLTLKVMMVLLSRSRAMIMKRGIDCWGSGWYSGSSLHSTKYCAF